MVGSGLPNHATTAKPNSSPATIPGSKTLCCDGLRRLGDSNLYRDGDGFVSHPEGRQLLADGQPLPGERVVASQGSPISCVLANVFLTAFDRSLKKAGFVFLRHIDDVTIVAAGREDTDRVARAAATPPMGYHVGTLVRVQAAFTWLVTAHQGPIAMTNSGSAFPADSIVQALVAEYQQDLAAGDTPTTTEYLERISDEFKPALAEHLVLLEYVASFRNGWLPTVEDFKSRLPQHGDLVERVLLNAAGSQGLRYVLVRKLGQGQMGEVFLARDEIGRDVAIKLLKRAGRISEAAQRAFSEEIKAMACIGLHRNVVALYHKDILPDGKEGSTAAVMQYVPGQTLRQHLDSLRGRHQIAAVPDVVQLVLGITHGLAHIQRGQLQAHRDLKPENIILDGSQSPLIADFGLATLLSQDRTAGTVRGGTPKYMAPEQVRHFLGNDREDLHNCDIWAVGMILYEGLTGELPFRGTGDELFANIECAIPVPPRRLRDDLAFNAALEQICLKCLEKRPEDRYSTAADLRDALQAWLDAYQGTPKLLKEIRDFTGVRQQYEHVTERRSITDQITRFLETNAKGLLVIKGPPGKGKSGIAVELERRLTRLGGHRPVAFYFRNRTADVDECVRHVYASLAIQHEISSPDTYRLPPEPDKALRALRLLLRDVACRVDSERPQVIILDALDEAQSGGEAANPYQVINQLMLELPEHVYLVATTRVVPEVAILECDAPYEEIDLDNPDYLPQYRRDVRNYLESELHQPARAGLAERLLDQVAQIADGNFLVARLICNELRQKGGAIRDTEAVFQELLQEKGPNRLGQLYQRFVKRLLNHPRVCESVGGVLRVLAFAEADVTPTLIRAATSLQLEQWHTMRDVLQEFLYIKPAEPAGVQEDRIRPFHTSFREYLRNRVFHGDEKASHGLLTAACVRWNDLTDASRDYALRYALFHTLGAADDQTIEKLWRDYEFLEAKADAGLIGSLKLDLDCVAERFRSQGTPASGLVQDFANAIWESISFIECHPSTFFQCMWNSLWWIDSPEANEWQNAADGRVVLAPDPNPSEYCSRSAFVEGWRDWKERHSPCFTWIRAVTPSARRPGECFFLQGHRDFISALEASEDGCTALSASGDRSLRLWDVATAKQIANRDDTEARIDVMRFCKTVGSHGAFLGGDAHGTLCLWDARSLALIAKVSAHADGVRALAVSDAGQWAVSAGRDGSLVVHELPTLRQLARWQTEERVITDGTMARYTIFSVTVYPQAEEILFTVETDVYRWNWRRGECRKWLAGNDDGVYTLCEVSRDGARIAIWQIEIDDPENPTLGAILSMQDAEEIALLDEQYHHGKIAERREFSGCSSSISEIRFAPNGDTLAVADLDWSGVWYWQPPNQYRFIPISTTTPYSPEGGVHCVAFAADNFLLCGGGHSAISAWSIDVGIASMPRRKGTLLTRLSRVSGYRSGSDFLLDPKGRYFILTDETESLKSGEASQLVFRIGDPGSPLLRCQSIPFPKLPRMDPAAYITCSAVAQNGIRAVFALSSAQLVILDSPHERGATARLIALSMLTSSAKPDEEVLFPEDGDRKSGRADAESFSQPLPHVSNTIAAVAISRLGGIITAATHDGRITMWQDGPHNQWATSTQGVNVVTMAIAADEATLAVGDEDGSVTLLRISDGEIIGRWQCSDDVSEHEHRRPVVFVHIDSEGERIACGFASGKLRWLHTNSGDWSTVGQVTYFADFPSLVAKDSDQGYSLQRVDHDTAVISANTGQAVAWVPSGADDLQRALADLSANVIVTLGADTRFYVREGNLPSRCTSAHE